MKRFGIEEVEKKLHIPRRKIALGVAYLIFVLASFILFSFYGRITGRIFSDHKIDIFNDLDQIAFYFWPFDQELSHQFLQLDKIVQSYLAGENVLISKKTEIIELWDYFSQNKHYLTSIGFDQYNALLNLVSDARGQKEEIFKLLWETEPFNYLVLLQNSNEKRPNWWFFGSFAFITLSGAHITEMQIVDSYLPDYIAPNARIALPQWTRSFLGESNAGFVAGNKYGFTDLDGKNIKTLYEKAFHNDYSEERKQQMFEPEKWDRLFQKNIKGVIFLDSEMIAELLPSFRNIAWKWQFINANIDIIRGEERSNKKEIYIQDLEGYLANNAITLAKRTINSFSQVLEKGFVNIYLSNVSDWLQTLLQDYHLTTVYHPDWMYFWNINTAYNKADAFLNKQVLLQDDAGKIIFSTDARKADISKLTSWIYHLYFTYAFDLPKSYQDEIYAREEEYHIKMTDRERYILSLEPLDPINKPFPKRWETVEVVYFPKHFEVLSISGDAYKQATFYSDFAQGLTFKSKILENQKTNVVRVDFLVP